VTTASRTTQSAAECAEECGRSANCASFSFGPSSARCSLSSLPAGRIDPSQDLLPDDDYDVYEFDLDRPECGEGNDDDDGDGGNAAQEGGARGKKLDSLIDDFTLLNAQIAFRA